MFPSQNILTFIGIIFRDMNNSYKIFESLDYKPLPGEIEIPYIMEKNNHAREIIKQFFGEYLSKCKDAKYDVLESIMKGVVFERRRLRESYL